MEQNKEGDGFVRFRWGETKEQEGDGGARLMIETGAEFPIGPRGFPSFPVPSDDHRLTVLRSIERNPVGAGLLVRAEPWRGSGSGARTQAADAIPAILAPWPVDRRRMGPIG